MEYGLIGEKLSHSFSKIIHSMLGSYQYELYSIPQEKLEETIKSKAYKGFNVTIPYKQQVIPFCDFLSDTAKEISSVNTLVVDENGKLHGYNTDQYGFIYMAKRAGIDFRSKKVLILGSGGTSLTAVSAAKKMGAREINVVSRRGKLNYDNISTQADSEIIVNTTPVGMYPNNGDCAINLNDFPKCCGVVDVIYNPFYTRLLLTAKEMGIPCCNGLPMLVAQAKRSSELFCGKTIPETKIEEIHSELTKKLMNIVLIGMPGSGKTTLGKEVAEIMGKEFIDTDSLVENETKTSISQIFAEKGETEFRRLEADAVAFAGKQVGKVISTGGGAILNKENYLSLRQNGIIFYVDREINKLARNGRPLSKGIDELGKLLETRLPLYKKYSDKTIDNNGEVKKAAKEIAEVFYETAGY